MATAIEEAVFNALRGHHNEHTKLPSPRIIKIYIASLKDGKFDNHLFVRCKDYEMILLDA